MGLLESSMERMTAWRRMERPSGTAQDEERFPRTPDKFEITSKRGWEGKVSQEAFLMRTIWPPVGKALLSLLP